MKFATILLFGWVSISCYSQEDPWVSLFDEKTLNGWTQIGGVAEYRVADGAVVGITVANTPNSFLRTDQTFGDFILEYEVKLSGKTNSGVQIRSNSFPEYQNGRTHGYQIEIDPSERAWTGGIYDEARRGWLYSLEDKPEAQSAYRHLEWNKFRVEAIGDTIKTWVNQIPVAHLIDNETGEGFIALQVHSIDSSDNEGIEIRWRNIRIITETPFKHSKQIPIPAKKRDSNETNSQ